MASTKRRMSQDIAAASAAAPTTTTVIPPPRRRPRAMPPSSDAPAVAAIPARAPSAPAVVIDSPPMPSITPIEAFAPRQVRTPSRLLVDMQRVGAGAYGQVYAGRDPTTGRWYALKRQSVTSREANCGFPSHLHREVVAMGMLKSHRNVARLVDFLLDTDSHGIILEYVASNLRTELRAHFDASSRLPLRQVKSYAYQLLDGIAFCHACHIVHRDLKPENLLISRAGVLKVTDFGLCKLASLPREWTPGLQTVNYRAPEVFFKTQEHSPLIDLWSVGCILAEMLTGVRLFEHTADEDIIGDICDLHNVTRESLARHSNAEDFPDRMPQHDRLLRLVPEEDEAAIDLIKQLLNLRPSRRPTALRAMEHRFFDEVRDDVLRDEPDIPALLGPSA